MAGEREMNRRNAFKLAVAGIAGLAAPGVAGAQAPPSFPQPETPEQAFRLLTEGNARYIAQKMTSFEADMAILRADSDEHQVPFAGVLTCADSRVTPELVFDQSLGHLFITRVAGNVATSDMIASLEYAAAVLKIKAILVVGHTNCGAVKAAAAGKAVPGQISTLFPYIYPAIAGAAAGDYDAMTRKNAILQADVLRKASPVISGLIAEKALAVRASVYDVRSGKVTMLEG